MALSVKQKFSETLRQSVMAYAFNISGIVVGTIVAYNLGLFSLAPWAIAIYPPILSARGVIAGLFCGRLSTGLHLGTVQPRFIGNTKSFYLLFQAIIILTLEASVAMGLVAALFGSFFLGIPASDFFNILSVILATMALSLVIISPFTMIVSFLSFKHGLDPDIIVYPVASTISDLLITMTYILVLNLFIRFGSAGQFLIVFAGLILLFAAAYLLPKNAGEPEFVKTIRESLLTLVFVAFIVNVTGTTLGKIAEVVGERREIYTVYPALIDTIGDVGSVVGSTATTKLALGTLKSSLSSIRNHAIEISGAWAASLILFFIYSILSLIIQGLFTLPNFFRFTALLFSANVVAASFIIIISYAVAILTYQKGLDPDNFVIPIESSLADSITTLSLLLALGLIG
ncbi:MAG: magnesium transporter [Candidatus Bathyarchaeaceae archaeon]